MSVLRNFGLGEKFALLGFVGALLFLVPFVFYVRQASDTLGAVQEEQAGIAPAVTLLRVIHRTQQHGGRSDAAQDGGATQQADHEYDTFSAMVRSGVSDPGLLARWSKVSGGWARLKASRGTAAATPEVQAQYAALGTEQLGILRELSDYFRLDSDVDTDSNHLITATLTYLPAVSEALNAAKLRVGAVSPGTAPDPAAQAAIRSLAQTARTFDAQVTGMLATPLATSPRLKQRLGVAAQASHDATANALTLLEAQSAGAATPAESVQGMTRALDGAIDAQFALAEATMGELQQMLDERLSAQSSALLSGLAAMATLLLLIGVFAVAVARSITRPIVEAVGIARRVAEGDLTVQVQDGGREETGQLMAALSEMTQNLRNVVADVSGGAQTVAHTSDQIALGNRDLSQRTEEQASTLEETASALEQLTATVSQNANSARQASSLALDASQVAGKGGSVVQQVVDTMSGISDASRRIADITGIIDSIAFQTNILALNAAVEAARAGAEGRGFAVVAAEVRSLAQRSAAAAGEIKSLIADSVGRVNDGTRLVHAAGETMQEIVTSVRQVTELVSEIAVASQEQSEGIGQVNAAMAQMEHAVQQNAALVEEASAATESMREEAATLRRMVSRFNIGADRGLDEAPPEVPRGLRGKARPQALPRPQPALMG
jgi:methyl-accepting chemotaxis protein